MFKKLLVLCLLFSFVFLSFATSDGYCENLVFNDNRENLLVRLDKLKRVENNHLRRLARLEEARVLLAKSSIKRNQKKLQILKFQRTEKAIRDWLVQNQKYRQ